MGSVSSKKKKKVITAVDSNNANKRNAASASSFRKTDDSTTHKPTIQHEAVTHSSPDQSQHSTSLMQQPEPTVVGVPKMKSAGNQSHDQEGAETVQSVVQSSQINAQVEKVTITEERERREESSDDEEFEKQNTENGKDSIEFEEKVKKALNGEFDFEIPEKTKIVRIFTSSTFTDTSVERNTLMERVYPRVKRFCQERGYEFQVVDMRWGIRDESTDDHLTSELCMRELRACQNLSTGPNFITFLGQKYGYRPFPPKIPANEFEKLLGAIVDADDRKLLQLWFIRDDNNVPVEYLLQPITSVLPDYRNYDNEGLRKKASGEWWTAFERMQVVLRRAADKALKKRDRHKYYMSVTEDEIRRGIITAPSPANHCFWFKRVITDLRENIDSKNAGKFMDCGVPGNADDDPSLLLNRLREKALPKVLPSSNITQYNVTWKDNGIDPNSSSEHAHYIQDLCKAFYDTLTGMIEKATSEREAVEVKDSLAEEVFDHMSFCTKKCQAFHGRETFLESIKETLLKNEKRLVVLFGESGCGKTSIMAKISTLVREWLDIESIAVVVRFIGISPDSSSVRLMLRSVCQQLCKVAGDDINKVPEDIKSLLEFFPECLENAANEKHVVLILDSLDQLSPDNGGRQMDWLPKELPENVYVVLSTLPGEEFECLQKLQAILPGRCLKEVPKIPLSEADLILSNWLQAAGRSLTDKQNGTVLDAFGRCQLPLYLKLAFDEACRWKSYTLDNQITLAESVKGIINALLDRVERIHGKTLVSHALGYITASKNGLTEIELEDLLSLDDEVLNDVYQYWTPPVRRLPPLLWIRIRSDIRDYLIDRGADGTRVIYWYHRQFIEVARERYLGEDQVKKIHANMSDYFLGTWAEGQKKPFTNKQGENMSMNRLVPEQPLMYHLSREKPIYNLRMLSELPYHLVYSDQLKTVKEKTLCNFDFILTKLRATSFEVVLDDFSNALNNFPDDLELGELEKTLRLSAVALETDPRQLATQLLGRLLPLIKKEAAYPYLSKLLEKAYSCPVPCLIPSRRCLTAPGGTLVSSLSIEEGNIHCCAFSCDGKTAFVGSTTSDGLKLQIVNIQTGRVQRKMNLTDPFEMVFTWSMKGSTKDKDIVLVMGSKYIFLVNTKTGKIVQKFHALEEETQYSPMPPVAFADDEDRLVAITDKNMKIWTVKDGKLEHTISVGTIDMDEEYGSVDTKDNVAVYSIGIMSNVFKVLNVKTGQHVREVEVYAQGEDASIKAVKVGAGDKVIVVPSALKSLRIYHLHTGAFLSEISEFAMNKGLHRLQVTDDGCKAVNIINFEVMITELETGEVRRTLKSKSFGTLVIHTNLYTRDGRFVFSIGNDNILRIYDLEKALAEDEMGASVMNSAVASIDTVTGLFPGIDKKHVIASATVQNSSEISVWDTETGAKVRALKCMDQVPPQEMRMCSPTRGVGYIYDVNFIHFKVYDLKEGKVERCLLGKASKRTPAFGGINENHLISFSKGRRNLKVLDIDTGRVTKQYKFGQKHRLEEMFLSKNGKMVVCSQASSMVEHPDKTLPLIALDTTTGEHRFLEIAGQQLLLTFSCISDDGSYLVCVTNDLQPRLWDLRSGILLHHLEAEEYPVAYATGISVPLQLALTAQSDGDINSWEICSGRVKHTFKCDTVDIILVSADGNVAYSRYRYRNSNLDAWDLKTGTKLASFTSDWKPERINIVGNILVLGQADSPDIMTLRLHIPGCSSPSSGEKSPFDGLPVDGILQSCPDSPSADDGDEDIDDDGDKSDVAKSEFTKKALNARPDIIIGGGNIVDAKNVFISEAVFKQNFQK